MNAKPEDAPTGEVPLGNPASPPAAYIARAFTPAGEQGAMHRLYDVLACWRERASDVSGRRLACGHYLAEELPDETAAELQGFFSDTLY